MPMITGMIRFRLKPWFCAVFPLFSLLDPSVAGFLMAVVVAAVGAGLLSRYVSDDVSPEGIRVRRLVLPNRTYPAGEIVRVHVERGAVVVERTTGKPVPLFQVPVERVDEVSALLARG